MNSPDAKPGYYSLIPPDSTWQNRCPARICLTFAAYRPISLARRVKCPALILAGDQDAITPKAATMRAVARRCPMPPW